MRFCLFALIIAFISCKQSSSLDEKDPSPMLSPADELKTFQIEPGLKIQLVASEPMIQDPVVITFDEDGRLWVVEMRGFMPDIDGKGEKDRVGRVSVLEDKDGDGVMDTAITYIDSLILPRGIALVPHGALIVENASLWLTQDLNHDLHADTKTLIDSTYAGNLLPEHSGNGLLRAMDNWYYNVKSRLRYRLANGSWIRDSTEFRGQWGLSQDDEGRLYYNYNWSQLHADLVPPNYFSRNVNHTTTTGLDQGLTLDRRIYPIRPTPAVNRGYIPGTLDSQGRILEFTAACSPFYYRGKTLPNEYYGNVFVCEPSGNLVKRNITHESGLTLSAMDPHPGREFLSSTDERFRPVFLASGPDGALYVTDMYRGLIQHGAYVTPYLREQTIKRNLVFPVHLGRIWKIIPQDFKPPLTLKLSSLASVDILAFLNHENGWFRDMAQRLLVEKNDPGIKGPLSQLALNGSSPLSRIQALWTLEGMDILSPDPLFTLLSDTNALIRSNAIRLLEFKARQDKNINLKLGLALKKMWPDAVDKELLQIALSAGVLDHATALPILSGIVQRVDSSSLMRDAVLSSAYHMEYKLFQWLMKSGWKDRPDLSKEIFLEMLVTSIVRNAQSEELGGLLSTISLKEPLDWYSKTILHSMIIQGHNNKFKPIKLSAVPDMLVSTSLKMDSVERKILNNMFEWPGHTVIRTIETQAALAGNVDPKQYALGRQHYLSSCAGCHGGDGAGVSRFAPSLIGSEWVLGDEKRLALLLLHGIEGPIEIKGKIYDAPEILPVMPSHAILGDGEIAAIISYIRNEWGNAAAPVSTRTVGGARITTQGRVMPWTVRELNQHILDLKKDSIPK
ncbi:MAG: c-type cytochrome [Saprospiraceae bacterium]